MARFVIDASAVIAVLRNERGAEVILPLCAGSLISTVNLQEIIKTLIWQGVSIDNARTIIDALRLDIRSHEVDDAYEAAALLPFTQKFGSGLGDRTCMALAISMSLPALTTDRAWANLAIEGLDVIVAR